MEEWFVFANDLVLLLPVVAPEVLVVVDTMVFLGIMMVKADAMGMIIWNRVMGMSFIVLVKYEQKSGNVYFYTEHWKSCSRFLGRFVDTKPNEFAFWIFCSLEIRNHAA